MRTCASILSWVLVVSACAGHAGEGGAQPGEDTPELASARSASCPATAPAPYPLPGVRDSHLTLDYWLEQTVALGDLDEPLLRPTEIAAHDLAISDDPENGLPTHRGSLAEAPTRERLIAEVRTRLGYLREHITAGTYVDGSGKTLAPDEVAAFADVPLEGTGALHLAVADIPLRCGPREPGFYKEPVDLAFDRNSCSTIRAQEPVQVLMRWPNGMQLARTRYALGWIAGDAPLSPPISSEAKPALLKDGPMLLRAGAELTASDGAVLQPDVDTLLLTARGASDEREVVFADTEGLHRASARGLLPTARPLTRRALLEEAFRRMDRPYGWGGHEGGLDCSRFVMDVLATFGLELPRHSGRQAGAGTHTIDLRAIEELDERERLIDAAARRGIVLLHFPGHIMLYLGRDAEGTPRVIHSFSEYVEPCEGGADETLRRVDRVTVSDLTLGRGSSRRSFLERIEEVVILGRALGPELRGVASSRAPAPPSIPSARTCTDSLDVRIMRSPARPNVHQPLRVFVTSTDELGPMSLTLVDPAGQRHTPEVRRLGGPPFAYWTEIERPSAGAWTVLLGDGPNVAACERIAVARFQGEPAPPDPARVWEPRLRWEADTEALYSAFIEQLFDYPIEEDLTWRGLSVLLQDPSRNILFNHLGQDEDTRLQLTPDCADLPYFLRGYFAWKLRLPFGYRACSRGRPGRPPSCGELLHPEMEHEYTDEVEAFQWFIRLHVKRTVHSASGRTHPRDSDSALYPVPMTLDALRPGAVFSDPYGHLLIVARWVPQGAGDDYGILIGADAQPDGTVGRRRFWRGTFLFDPDTTDVGAGFKAFRPIVYDREARTYESLPNEAITARAGYVPFSMAQYEGTTDSYYERMETIINPRPLDAWRAQVALIDALESSATRRVVSVQNGEDWKASNPGKTIDMPEGSAIFLTAGAWENFSTPSRDLRMLIAMDTVMRFPDVLRRSPARFGVSAEEAESAAETLRGRLADELARRSFTYRRSDGEAQTLTLAALVGRASAFEMAYNPNDCVERRWGAPEGSDEMRSCTAHAPAAQRERMAEYREWFATRRRPVE